MPRYLMKITIKGRKKKLDIWPVPKGTKLIKRRTGIKAIIGKKSRFFRGVKIITAKNVFTAKKQFFNKFF